MHFWGIGSNTTISGRFSGVGRKSEVKSGAGWWAWGGAGERMTHSFGFVPGLDLTQVVVRPGRKFKRKFKPKQPVGELHEIKQP